MGLPPGDYRSSSYKQYATERFGGIGDLNPEQLAQAKKEAMKAGYRHDVAGYLASKRQATEQTSIKKESIVRSDLTSQVAIKGREKNIETTYLTPQVSGTTSVQQVQEKEDTIRVPINPALYGALKNQKNGYLGNPGLYALGTRQYYAEFQKPSDLDIQREIGHGLMSRAGESIVIRAKEIDANRAKGGGFLSGVGDYVSSVGKGYGKITEMNAQSLVVGSQAFAKGDLKTTGKIIFKGSSNFLFTSDKDIANVRDLEVGVALGGATSKLFSWGSRFLPGASITAAKWILGGTYAASVGSEGYTIGRQEGFGSRSMGYFSTKAVSDVGSFGVGNSLVNPQYGTVSKRTLNLFSRAEPKGMNPTEVVITPKQNVYAKRTFSGSKSLVREDLGIEVVTPNEFPTDKYTFLGKSFSKFLALGSMVPGEKKLGFGFVQDQKGGFSYLKRSGRVFDYFAVQTEKGADFFRVGKSTGKVYDLGFVLGEGEGKLFSLTEPVMGSRQIKVVSPVLESGGGVPDYTHEVSRQVGRMRVVNADFSGRFRARGDFFLDVQGSNLARTIKRGYLVEANVPSGEGSLRVKQTVYKFEDGLLPEGKPSSFKVDRGWNVNVDRATFGKVDIQQRAVVRGYLDFPGRPGRFGVRFGRDVGGDKRLLTVRFGKDVPDSRSFRFKFGDGVGRVSGVEGLGDLGGLRLGQSVSSEVDTRVVSRGVFGDLGKVEGLGGVRLGSPFGVGKVGGGLVFGGLGGFKLGGRGESRGKVDVGEVQSFKLGGVLLNRGRGKRDVVSEGRSGFVPVSRFNVRSFGRSNLRQVNNVRNEPRSEQRLSLQSQSDTKLVSRPRVVNTPNFKFDIPKVPVPTTPPPFDLPGLNADLSGGWGLRNYNAKRSTKYTPSFSALFYNIRGKYKKGTLSKSGIDFRPITSDFTILGKSRRLAI